MLPWDKHSYLFLGGGRHMDLDRVRWVLQAVIGAAVGFWRGLPELTQLLLWLMVLDTALGVLVAIRNRDLSAQAAWQGATKKVGTLVLVGVAALIDRYIGQSVFDLLRAGSMFYCLSELTSITRNAAQLDLPVFSQLQNVLRYFQDPKNHANR